MNNVEEIKVRDESEQELYIYGDFEMDWEKYFSLNILTSPSTLRTWEFIESA